MFRRFRFGLRTLLVAIMCIAAGAAWFGCTLRAAEIQRLAVDRISGEGGIVLYDRYHHTIEVVFVLQPGRCCGQTVCLNEKIPVSGARFDDDDLPLLTQLRRLRQVNFTGSHVTTAAIEQFRRTHHYLDVKP